MERGGRRKPMGSAIAAEGKACRSHKKDGPEAGPSWVVARAGPGQTRKMSSAVTLTLVARVASRVWPPEALPFASK